MFVLVLPRLFVETFLDLLYFPLWWYSGGAYRAGVWCLNLLLSGNNHFAPGLWLRNLFIPMYGQYDFEGRIISFFMRLAQFFVRLLALFVWSAVCLVLFLVWLSLPVIIIFGLWSINR